MSFGLALLAPESAGLNFHTLKSNFHPAKLNYDPAKLNYAGRKGKEKETSELHIQEIATGLGFIERKRDGTLYVRWARIEKYLQEVDFATCCEDGYVFDNAYIPENIFYKL